MVRATYIRVGLASSAGGTEAGMLRFNRMESMLFKNKIFARKFRAATHILFMKMEV